MPPIIGLTADVTDECYASRQTYAAAVHRAGGVPVILPCIVERIEDFLRVCDGIVLTGGDDPDTSQWGIPLHPQAKPLHPARQAFETALLRALDSNRDKPALGICLGMQLMGLHAGGGLDQHLPDHLVTASMHWDSRAHEVSGELGQGVVHSHHRQALSDPGRLRVIAQAPDGVIEAVRADDRPFYLGVQWHPERTADDRLGLGVIGALVHAAGEAGKAAKSRPNRAI